MSYLRRLVVLSLVASLLYAIHPAVADPYMFIAYGDTRSQPDVHRAVIARIVAARPEFVIQSGDLVENGRSSQQWAEFDKIEQPLRDAKIAYYPARGNHDLGSFYIQHVPKGYDSGNGYYYAFT